MSKLSFRARALDVSKPLPIYHADDLPDLSDFSTINRTVPQMPTGMEKEEESERHLQDVIQAKQTNNVKKHHVYIPTPEAAIPVNHYDEFTQKIARGHQYVRVPGLGIDEVPDYDLDSEDEEWLNAQSNERPLSPTHFERMMDKLEKGSGNTVLSEREAQGLLRDDENLVLAVYDYWLAKRLRLGRSLIPVVKQEGRDVGSGSNPYLAFRKRTEKMQTRKNRKNDETAYMQMLKLKRDLEKAVSLFELVKDREQKKEQCARVQMDIFKKRYQLEDWSGNIMSSLQASTKSRHNSAGDWEHRRMKIDGDYEVHHMGRHEVLVPAGRKKKKRRSHYYSDVHSEAPLTPSTPDKLHRDSLHDLSSDRLEDEDYDGLFTFKRKPHVRYHSCRDPLGVWPWSNDDLSAPSHKDYPGDGDVMLVDYAPYAVSHAASRERARNSLTRRKYQFSRTSLSRGGIGLARRRVGRGGRVLLDRLNVKEPPEDPLGTPVLDEQPLKETPPTESQPKDGEGGGANGTPLEVPMEEEDSLDTSFHFHPSSPLPSSSFEFTHLPLIGSTDTATKPPSVTSAPLSGISLAFRGIPLSSELREDAKTFSTLPTSQFFLKSVTPVNADIDYQGSLLSSESSWGLVPGVKGQLDPRYSRTTSEQSSNSPLHSPSAPSNYPNGPSTSDASNDRTRQVSTEIEQTVAKELSRSSLSVADSKTIVLSNVPLPRPKHQLEKSQRQSSTSSESAPKDASKAPAAGPSKKEEPPAAKDGTLTKDTSSADKAASDQPQSKPEPSKESEKVKQKPAKAEEKVVPSEKPESKPSESSAIDSKCVETKAPAGMGTISTPADYIKRFDTAPSKPRLKGNLRRKSRTLIASHTTATLITSQLGLFQTAKKKDTPGPFTATQTPGSATSQTSTSTASDVATSDTSASIANSVSTLNAAKLAEIQSSLLNSQDKTSTPVSEIGSGLTGFPDRRTSTSVSVPHTTSSMTANSHVGQALSSVTSAVARRTSAGTNGTNYQEIFHTATRRISESAERGLKQALAGMNHNSLIETANSLVQLSNSSEVT